MKFKRYNWLIAGAVIFWLVGLGFMAKYEKALLKHGNFPFDGVFWFFILVTGVAAFFFFYGLNRKRRRGET